MHGTADPTVSFTEGMNFYNALRFNGKQAAMLAYTGRGARTARARQPAGPHRRATSSTSITTSRATPAPKWMTDGVPFIAKDLSKEPVKPVIMKR